MLNGHFLIAAIIDLQDISTGLCHAQIDKVGIPIKNSRFDELPAEVVHFQLEGPFPVVGKAQPDLTITGVRVNKQGQTQQS